MGQKTLEGNRLISEFMGATPCKLMGKTIGIVDAYECEEWKLPVDEIQYHSSWDWLMPVIEKIESLHYDVQICTDSVSIIDMAGEECAFNDYQDFNSEWHQQDSPSAENKIHATWLSAIEFIKWHTRKQII